jgi:probable addiction module antidote protein
MSKHARLAPFDAADYLDSEETIAEFLALAAEDETPGVFMRAVEAVAKARGIAQVAEASGLSRESLYKALAPDAQPRFDTVRRVLGALGVGFAIVPHQTRDVPAVGGRSISARSVGGAVRIKRLANMPGVTKRKTRSIARAAGSRSSGGASRRTKGATLRR